MPSNLIQHFLNINNLNKTDTHLAKDKRSTSFIIAQYNNTVSKQLFCYNNLITIYNFVLNIRLKPCSFASEDLKKWRNKGKNKLLFEQSISYE